MEKEFTPITLSTQEEMQSFIDSKVGERLARAERKHSEVTYGLQSDLDKKVEENTALQKSIEELNGKSAESAKTIEELTAKVKAYELSAVKTRICAETGLSHDLIDFIKGDTEEDMKASAEILAKHTKGFKSEMPKAKSEPARGGKADTVRDSLRTMLQDMTK